MIHILATFPWPETGISAAVGFALGFIAGGRSGRPQPRDRRSRAMTQPKWRLVYEKIAPVLVVFCLLASLFASVGTYYGSRVNAKQDRARTADNTRLLGCFNEYAKASSASSTAVRVASVRKDAATTERDNTLNEEGQAFLTLVDHLLTNSVTPHDVQDLRDTLRRRATAAAKLDRAQVALDKAREDNPVPPPPSIFCS